MTQLNAKLTSDELTRDTGQQPVEGHDAWVRQQLQSRLDKKAAGDMNYSSLDEVAAEFGFDAR
ncbi:MAG: hypothetical protein KUA43_12730 [Hoeflea sp.]|uniref:hypothetical protein n=1 Tax=Hoeflea sp. TaxID=1940281 RepID=UPI001E0C744E|nr:hypothetical protein [Hoeflea sp.]MBU4527878.1 hypothetical protein [Alphaproteobacteria bacterium]MBU4546087.1 hypothetical protein [Alphaproteobacteria bacterium]MBU4553228.1 hypothetical protein [Alphaproteobacteria bacterium]MBV1724300.1 hypothetical protein [Hoeflea sp.]MBV1759985.1 hypothetical protein [Hoeflea sp.]